MRTLEPWTPDSFFHTFERISNQRTSLKQRHWQFLGAIQSASRRLAGMAIFYHRLWTVSSGRSSVIFVVVFVHFFDESSVIVTAGNRVYGSSRGGGELLYCFPPKFLDPVRLPVWRHIVTGKSRGSLVQFSKGYDSYLDERGRGKAKKLADIAIYRLFDRMCVSFGVAIICLCKPFWYFVSVIVKFC